MILLEGFLVRLMIGITKNPSRRIINVTWMSKRMGLNSKKNGTKKPMLFLAALGKTGLSHDIFFKFSVGPFELFEVESQKKLNFEI